ncbi:MAG: hypothetical protein CSA62_07910 [Planctomycetota bacterium]|nr:MAG: hypothetical protein CSA62_07910 [Planctomycetota bacterium]
MVKKPTFFEKLFGGAKTDEKSPPRSSDRGVKKPDLAKRDRVVPRPESKVARDAAKKPSAPVAKQPERTKPEANKPEANKPEARTPEAKVIPTPEPKSPANGSVSSKPSAPKAAQPSPSPEAPQKETPKMDLPPQPPTPAIQVQSQESPSVMSRVLGTSKREEAAQALTDGFQDLSKLLKTIDERMVDQGAQAREMSSKFDDMPAMARAQIDFMAKVAMQMTEQKEQTGKLLDRLGGLPQLLDGIHQALESNALAERRTERTLDDFRDTMNRIHDSIGTLTTESQKAVRETAASFERSHARASETFRKTQEETHDSFQRSQDAHLRKLEQMMESNQKSTRAITTMLVVVAAAVVIVLFTLVLGG